MPELLIETDGPIRILRLNRPEKHNALNRSLTEALLNALRDADRAIDVRAVVLCGAGPSFCSGADVSEFAGLGPDAGDAAQARADLTTSLHAIFPTLTKPVVGAVHGRALGGGAGLALACDLLVLAAGARIGYPELAHGLVAAIVMANLVRQTGPKASFELVALAEPVDADRALQLGLANRVVPAGQEYATARTLALALAHHDPIAMVATKRLFHRVADLAFDDALRAGRDANVAMRGFRTGKAD